MAQVVEWKYEALSRTLVTVKQIKKYEFEK
jgi:hypothetical protein